MKKLHGWKRRSPKACESAGTSFMGGTELGGWWLVVGWLMKTDFYVSQLDATELCLEKAARPAVMRASHAKFHNRHCDPDGNACVRDGATARSFGASGDGANCHPARSRS